jgi:hypothetical protein
MADIILLNLVNITHVVQLLLFFHWTFNGYSIVIAYTRYLQRL